MMFDYEGSSTWLGILSNIFLIVVCLFFIVSCLALLPDPRSPECRLDRETVCKNKSFHCFHSQIEIQRCLLYWEAK